MVLNMNYIVADMVSKLNLASVSSLRFVKIFKTDICLRILRLMYKHGIIRSFVIYNTCMSVYLKYNSGSSLFSKISVVSRPGNSIYWSGKKFRVKLHGGNFSNVVYFFSTQKGLLASDYCNLGLKAYGEVLMKVYI